MCETKTERYTQRRLDRQYARRKRDDTRYGD